MVKKSLSDKLSAIGWALFFIWVGVAYLLSPGSGIALLGIGVIILGIQFVRKSSDLPLEGFWVVVGLLFVLGSIWDTFEAEIPLIPILLIVAGVVILLSIMKRKGLPCRVCQVITDRKGHNA